MRKDKVIQLKAPRRREREEITTRSKVFSHLSATALAILFVFAISQFRLDGLRGGLVDVLFRTQWWRSPSPNVELIAYDDDSSARYSGGVKIPAEEIARVFDQLEKDRPLAVAVLAPINEKTYSEAELELIAKSFSKVPNTYVGYTDNESLGKNPPPELLHTAKYLPGFVSRDTFSYGADSVSRRVMVTIEGIPTVYAKLAELFQQKHSGTSIPATLPHSQRFERVGDSTQTYINWQGPAGTYPEHSSLAVAEGLTPAGTFSNKLVLFSSVLRARHGEDHIFTPYSRDHFRTSLLEGAANGLVTLIRGNGISKTSDLFNFFITLFIAILTVNCVLYFAPGRGILFLMAEIVVLFALGWILLFKADYWLDIAHPLLVACVGYYLVIPYRLLDEYRKRWHYQEKSELMAQLEQLKSNFLSLMSHDLKTPIARIQGNAELALNDSAGNLSEDQRRSLHAIVDTTDDLSRHVEMVLDLTRIESAKVPLQRASKDINAVIREVVASKEFMAHEKQLTVQTSLEPLFSFKFDVKLIRQVLANLLENAIKYSPPGTVITLASKDEGEWVRVSVEDTGIGIPAEEQDKVFSKFYRSQNPLAQQEKGSGLGLYLVKYFVELHHGFVELRSEVGKGSVFTVSLPVGI